MSWTCLDNKVVRARKQHVCDLCNWRIRKGAKHVSRRGVDSELGFVTCHMHEVCEAQTHDWTEGDWEMHDPIEFQEMHYRTLWDQANGRIHDLQFGSPTEITAARDGLKENSDVVH